LLLVLSAARGALAADWVPVGLPGATVNALAAASSDPRVVYAATWGSGVYRSTDGGRSWTRRNGSGATGLADYNVFCLAVDPSNPAIVYAGTNQAGIFKTSDGGATWSHLPTDVAVPHLAPVEDLAVDPVRPGTVYATYSIFLIKSTDGGAHWARSDAGIHGDSITVAVDPRVPRTLYAGVTGEGVYKSVNGGVSWTLANRGIENASIYQIALDPRNRNRLYAYGYKDSAIQLFTSADAGLTWRAANRGLPAGARPWTVAVDAAGTAYAGTSSGVYKSADGGARWRPANQGTAGLLVGALAAHPRTAGVLWAGTGRTSLPGSGVYRTTDGGGTWTAARRGMTGGEVNALAAGPVPPGGEPALYAGTPAQGVFGRPEGRADWVSLRAGNSEAVLVDPENPDILYTAGNGGVFRSADRGATWVARNQGLASGGTVPKIFALAFNAADSGILYAGGSQAIYKSADGGVTWRRTAFVAGTRVESFGTAADDPAVLYATGRQIDIVGNPGLLMKSTDGGETWAPLAAFSAQQRLAADPADAGIVLIADNGTLTRSGDGGATFAPISFEGPAEALGCTAVVFDPTAPGVAYAAFFTSGRQPATFVFQSLDSGITWTLVEAPGIGSSFVLNLTVDDTGALYAATRGGGIYKLELP
jgi:photosystem II stability/assembly factor-like uncharacterized protein